MTFVAHVLGAEALEAYDPRKVYNEFALMVNAADCQEAYARFQAWHILCGARRELERKTHHMICTDQCRCPKKVKRAKRILTHAIRQVQYPIFDPRQWPIVGD